LSPSYADDLEILGSSTLRAFRPSPGLCTDCFTFYCAEQELQGTVSSIAVSLYWNLNYVLSKFLLFNFEIVVIKKKFCKFVFVQKTGNINYCCTDKMETFEVC